MTTSYEHDNRQLAETYDRVSDSQFESGKRLAERLGLRERERVLDVGAGTGRLARWMAGVVGPKGAVVGIDPLPERVAVARANVAGVTFEVGKAEDLGAFPSEHFDVVCMSSVFHWVVDKPKALAEVRRVLRPGGRLGITTMPQELRIAGTIATVIAPILRRPPYAPRVDLAKMPMSNQMRTTTEIITMLLDAGLELVELHVVERERIRPSGAAILEFLESSSFGNFLRIVPEDLRASLRADLTAGFDALKGPEGVPMRDYGMALGARRPA